MFKTVLTLFRGSVAAAGEELEGRTALLILNQQMRDSAAAVERAKRALALAIAQDQQEGRRLDSIKAQIADLEVRAIAALDGERNDLANDAAEAIAALEADRDAATTALTLFAAEITRRSARLPMPRSELPSSTGAAASRAPRKLSERCAGVVSRRHGRTRPRCPKPRTR